MNRNYSLDIIRTLSMFMIVVIHNLWQGGVLFSATLGISRMAAFELENLGIIAVNLFALLTGYLNSGKGIKITRLLNLYFEVLFLSILSLIIYSLIWGIPNIKIILTSIFPVLTGGYWYFTAYLLFAILEPLLSVGISHISNQTLLKIDLVALFLAGTIGFTTGRPFENGYSTLWLIILFLTGYLLKTYHVRIENFSKWKLSFIIVLMTLISLLGETLVPNHSGHFLIYTSPMVIIQSIATFMLVSQIQVSNLTIQRLLLFTSPLTFGVYILDTTPVFFDFILKDLFKNFTLNHSILLTITLITFASILMFIMFILINYLRVQLFKLLKLDVLIDRLAEIIHNLLNHIS